MKYFRLIVAILAVAITLFRGYLFITKSDIDEGPIITCDQEVFELECGQDLNELLQYVSAYDEKDGNIEKIFVESSFYLYEGNKSKVAFVAIDSDSNISKCEREVIYIDYAPPVLTMNSSGIFVATDAFSFVNLFSAQDKFEGDISSRVKIICESYSKNSVGTFPMKAKVCNVFGDTVELEFNLYALREPYSKHIELSQYVLYLSAGQEKPDFKTYISDCSGSVDNVIIDDSSLNLSEAGSYEVCYRIGDDKNIEAFNRLVVVVGE
jgi:hypothetical protein